MIKSKFLMQDAFCILMAWLVGGIHIIHNITHLIDGYNFHLPTLPPCFSKVESPSPSYHGLVLEDFVWRMEFAFQNISESDGSQTIDGVLFFLTIL